MSSQFISPEHRGLAREFRRKVEAAELAYDAAIIAQVVNPLHARLGRKPTLRKDIALDMARTAQSIPNPFSLSSDIRVRRKGWHLQITDILLGGTQDREESWDEFDKTVGIVRVMLTTEGGVHIDTKPLVTISAHAIARWYERTGSRDEAKLISDIGMILTAKHPEHAAASTGVWLGPTISAHAKLGDHEVRTMKVRTIRTFISADMMVYPSRSQRLAQVAA